MYTGPPGHQAELVLPQFRFGIAGEIIKEVTGVESVVSSKPEYRAMQVVRASLADNVDLIGTEAILGRIGRGLLFEFLDGIYRQNDARSAQGGVGVRGPVEQIVVRGRPGSVNADGVPGALTHNALLAAGLNGTIAEKQKLQEVSTVQRQFRNLPLSHCRPYRRRLRVDRCRGL